MAAGQEVLFEVSVRDSAGHNQIIQVTATTTVSDIKRQFSRKTGLAQQSYQLVFAGRSLNDSDTLQVLNEPHPHTFLTVFFTIRHLECKVTARYSALWDRLVLKLDLT